MALSVHFMRPFPPGFYRSWGLELAVFCFYLALIKDHFFQWLSGHGTDFPVRITESERRDWFTGDAQPFFQFMVGEENIAGPEAADGEIRRRQRHILDGRADGFDITEFL